MIDVRNLKSARVKLSACTHRADDGDTCRLRTFDKLQLTADGVTVTVLINGTKTYDHEGEDAENMVRVFMNLFMEEDQHCARWTLKTNSVSVGEEFYFEFAFNAVQKPYQRQFYITLSESRSDSAE